MLGNVTQLPVAPGAPTVLVLDDSVLEDVQFGAPFDVRFQLLADQDPVQNALVEFELLPLAAQKAAPIHLEVITDGDGRGALSVSRDTAAHLRPGWYAVRASFFGDAGLQASEAEARVCISKAVPDLSCAFEPDLRSVIAYQPLRLRPRATFQGTVLPVLMHPQLVGRDDLRAEPVDDAYVFRALPPGEYTLRLVTHEDHDRFEGAQRDFTFSVRAVDVLSPALQASRALGTKRFIQAKIEDESYYAPAAVTLNYLLSPRDLWETAPTFAESIYGACRRRAAAERDREIEELVAEKYGVTLEVRDLGATKDGAPSAFQMLVAFIAGVPTTNRGDGDDRTYFDLHGSFAEYFAAAYLTGAEEGWEVAALRPYAAHMPGVDLVLRRRTSRGVEYHLVEVGWRSDAAEPFSKAVPSCLQSRDALTAHLNALVAPDAAALRERQFWNLRDDETRLALANELQRAHARSRVTFEMFLLTEQASRKDGSENLPDMDLFRKAARTNVLARLARPAELRVTLVRAPLRTFMKELDVLAAEKQKLEARSPESVL